MKKFIFGAFIGAMLVASVAYKVATYEPSKSTADVNQVQGMYIFTDCKPFTAYDYLGSVKTNDGGGMVHGYYQYMRDNLIKKAKKDFPTGDALIITGEGVTADVVKLK